LAARQALIDAARSGEDADDGKAALVRVIEYEVPGREGDGSGELIALITWTKIRPATCG
jgi:hypothetical protein